MDSSTPQAPRKRAPVPALGPWAITQEGLELCLAVWSRGSLFAAALERAGEIPLPPYIKRGDEPAAIEASVRASGEEFRRRRTQFLLY